MMCLSYNKDGPARKASTKQIHRFAGAILPVFTLLTLLFSTAVFAQGQPLPATAPRSRQAIDQTRVNESWARDWEVTHTASEFPGGGRTGFYRRPPRMSSAAPYTGREGILYLYPESDYKPARISRKNIKIAQDASLLIVSACANRTPRGEWILKILINDEQLGDEVIISGRDGWRDIAFDLTTFLDQRVDIEIQAHASARRESHVYIDDIRLENPAGRPMSSLTAPDPDGRNNFDAASREPANDEVFFDIYYKNFLELLRDREKRRRNDRDYIYILNRNNSDCCRRRP